ncbi:hypothetical protein NUW58_g1912 [Xylaria curta]|uniref:Uncharacterized protein n=1 Tax=Xylaria curta TaxID=42375 RepID=A0ACC1PJG9_9PEZI|nr:hypothetical protein NUW58_g1912 [Xylaria curta]
MSLGKVVASAISTPIEATMALANFNFDFSLVQVKPPAEYQPIKAALSSARTKEAEEGTFHITARKLGALFKGVVPNTHHLFRAYGLRASEIVQSPTHNPRGTRDNGIFADRVGADGTSIWAAATSGNEAIAVHLLACMLARLWTGSQATSLWVELVKERRKILAADEADDPCNVPSLSASKISLTRDQLATWDASARSWLRTADQVKEVSQKQLLLIINNLGIGINNKSTVYESVVQVWTVAMTMVDRLIGGIPQSVTEGGLLLGLSSWHLYPDMMVVVKGSKAIKQQDDLISPGGVVTLGLKSAQKPDQGIFWSLPLSFHRYYGDPLIVKGSYNADSARIPVDDLFLVGLGSLLSSWFKDYADFITGAEIMSLLYSTIETELGPFAKTSWVAILAFAAIKYIASIKCGETGQIQLVKTGRRRYRGFLNPTSPVPRLFRLNNPSVILSLMEGAEERVNFLRHVAREIDTNATMIIQYWSDSPDIIGLRVECATVLGSSMGNKTRYKTTKRKFDESMHDTQKESTPTLYLSRWLSREGNDTEVTKRASLLAKSGERIHLLPRGTRMPCFNNYLWWREPPQEFLTNIGLGVLHQRHERTIEFKLVFGDSECAALYVILGSILDELKEDKSVSPDLIRHAMAQKLISPVKLTRHLDQLMDEEYKKGNPLRALATISSVLATKGVTVPLRFASQYLGKTRWTESAAVADAGRFRYPSLMPYILSLREAFSCIIMTESGSFNFDPSTLKSVMAVSSGNSLYVASRLLYDPLHYTAQPMITMIVGNLGKPGIALLVPPKQPRMRLPEENEWKCINHNRFDGKEENCFQCTTLHLNLSDWQMPLNYGEHGLRDSEVSFVEAFVSLHDHGEWVADLDVLGSLSSSNLHFLDFSAGSSKDCSNWGHSKSRTSDLSQFVSIDRWEELLEPPVERGVVRASGNWQARLAATVLAVQKGYQTHVVAKAVCWGCCLQYQAPVIDEEGDEEEDDGEEGDSDKDDSDEEYWACAEYSSDGEQAGYAVASTAVDASTKIYIA